MEMDVVARNPAGDWWQVCCLEGQIGWIMGTYFEVRGDAAAVPVAANIPPPPPPTNTPLPPPPTNTPVPAAPTATPVPTYPFRVVEKFPVPNNNPYFQIWAAVYHGDKYAKGSAEAGYRIYGNNGAGFEKIGHESEPSLTTPWQGGFLRNVNWDAMEMPGTFTWTIYLVDASGNQVSDAVTFNNREGGLYIAFQRR